MSKSFYSLFDFVNLSYDGDNFEAILIDFLVNNGINVLFGVNETDLLLVLLLVFISFSLSIYEFLDKFFSLFFYLLLFVIISEYSYIDDYYLFFILLY